MTTLLCGRCGTLVARIEDHRFGMDPSGSLCVRCSHPARRF